MPMWLCLVDMADGLNWDPLAAAHLEPDAHELELGGFSVRQGVAPRIVHVAATVIVRAALAVSTAQGRNLVAKPTTPSIARLLAVAGFQPVGQVAPGWLYAPPGLEMELPLIRPIRETRTIFSVTAESMRETMDAVIEAERTPRRKRPAAARRP